MPTYGRHKLANGTLLRVGRHFSNIHTSRPTVEWVTLKVGRGGEVHFKLSQVEDIGLAQCIKSRIKQPTKPSSTQLETLLAAITELNTKEAICIRQ